MSKTELGDESDAEYHSLPASPVSSETEGTDDGDAGLNARFLNDLKYLVDITTSGRPFAVLLSELAFVIASTTLALWLLPVPPSYVVQSHDVLDDVAKGLLSSPTIGLITICFVMLLTIVLPLYDLTVQVAKQTPAVTHLRQHSLALLFLSVQLVNISGFFTAIVPSLIYQALTANPRECTSLPALLLRASGYICAITLSKALLSVVESSAALLWRESLTRVVHKRYLHSAAHYHLALYRPAVDNPDQRIVREIELWSTRLSELIVTVCTSLFNVVWYSIQTWIISARLDSNESCP